MDNIIDSIDCEEIGCGKTSIMAYNTAWVATIRQEESTFPPMSAMADREPELGRELGCKPSLPFV